jgi:hypothetical protein
MQPTQFYDPAKEVVRDVFRAFIPNTYYFTPFAAGLVRAWNFFWNSNDQDVIYADFYRQLTQSSSSTNLNRLNVLWPSSFQMPVFSSFFNRNPMDLGVFRPSFPCSSRLT